jgi:hypothetical protein
VDETLQAALLTLVAILPGAIYLWGFEREAGKWGIGLSDAVLRFVAASALFQAAYAAPLYLLYTRYVHHGVERGWHMTYTNSVTDGRLPLWLIVVPLLYVAIPAGLGTAVGRSVRSKGKLRQGFARFMVGRDPAPRAWDSLFASRPAGAIRLRLKSEPIWLGGAFGAASYAAGYPEEPQDLLLEKTYQMGDDGTFDTQNGRFIELGSKLLVRFDEIEFLEFFPADPS